ncbi:MAG: ABC transporter ATP-binding protein [Bdellovibrionales bacterium]|nr:ABC transporter ATP-binding protein [Bdellovibrionales bacterium]
MSNILLRAEGIRKAFKKGKEQIEVIRGVNFQIQAGEMVAITGASGAGKSTLLHVLGTLEAPSQGRIFFGPQAQDILSLNEKGLANFRNRMLGFVFQFHYLLPEFNALENVMMPALIAGYGSDVAMQQARELLKFVGLEHRLTHRPAELSGGEQQRVAIARSVILRPKLLLADELTGNLDSANTAMVVDLLTRLNQATGVSVLMVTHDSELAKKMHRVLPMRDGVFVS